MNKREKYLADRKILMDSAESLIAEGKLDDFSTKEQDIKDLDAAFEASNLADANFAALQNKAIVPTGLQGPEGEGPEGHIPATTPNTPLIVFKNFAEQLRMVKNAASGNIDDRLLKLNNEATGMGEGVGSSGGFAVQTDFGGLMMESAAKAGEILSRVDSYNISDRANALKWIEIEEKSIATTVFGGVKMYWAAEAAEATESKPKLIEKQLELKKLMGVAYATYELENDSNFISELYTRAFSLGIQREFESCVVSGSGVGKPLGFLTGNGKVSVAKESGQVAATILWENISKMYHLALNKQSCIWLTHPDAHEQFDFLQFPVGVGGVPVYLQASSVGSVDSLKGRPVLDSDHCSAIGTAGDINFVDLSQYLMIYKGGADAQTSIHVEFLSAENCFRFIFRANGMPKRPNTITIKNSSKARADFVTLETR